MTSPQHPPLSASTPALQPERDAAMQEQHFASPQHARAFAMAVHLNAIGHLDWPHWTAKFAQALAKAEAANAPEPHTQAMIEALEAILKTLPPYYSSPTNHPQEK